MLPAPICLECRLVPRWSQPATPHTERVRRRRRERRAEYLEGKSCVRCGSTDDLQVDHIDPKMKTMHSSAIWLLSREKREAELAKCQVLCKPCHRAKTTAEQTRPTRHGTPSGYIYKRCRCDACRAWAAAYYQDYKRRYWRHDDESRIAKATAARRT